MQNSVKNKYYKDEEKRRRIRYKGAFPVELKNVKGMTRDFSGSGIFFETDKSFTSGKDIDFTIVLEYVDPGQPVYLKCRGKIVRVEDRGKKLGIAVKIRSYTFKKSNASRATQALKKKKKKV